MTDDATDPTLTPSQVIGVAATSAASEATTLQPASGKLPARYALGGALGVGGMGEVVLATDSQIGRDVAIKRMRVAPSPGAIARFVREAKIQGRLDHPAIVPVHELANDDEGQPFFVMKRLTGTTLAEILAQRTFSRQKLLRAFADVCLAIEFAHSRGVVHRDLKPANIMLGDFGEVYVLDWGVARILGETEERDATPVLANDDQATEAGAILGTPGYMAPEQLRGESLDGRADVFALGCILFEILAGEPLLPRGRDALKATLEPVDARPSQRAIASDIPPELDEVCARATQLDRDKRPTARDLAMCIERYLDGDRDLALRKNLAITHLDAARTALAAGDGEVERSTAMREAGRAIALDPRSSDAAALVGRLMLEPPRETPPEVTQHVNALGEVTIRQKARVQAGVMVAFLLFAPVFYWLGVRSDALAALFAATVLFELFVMLAFAYKRRAVTNLDAYLLTCVNGISIAILARLFSPFLIAPPIAAVSVVLIVLDPRLRWGKILLITSIAALSPWVLELTGVLSRTMGATAAGDLVLHSPLVRCDLPRAEIVLALALLTMLTFAGLTARSIAVSHRKALASIELQAWHLRQLVKR